MTMTKKDQVYRGQKKKIAELEKIIALLKNELEELSLLLRVQSRLANDAMAGLLLHVKPAWKSQDQV